MQEAVSAMWESALFLKVQLFLVKVHGAIDLLQSRDLAAYSCECQPSSLASSVNL